MFLVDFEYDGEKLSDYGYSPCYINTTSNMEINIGSRMSFNSVKTKLINTSRYVSYEYEEPSPIIFDIYKRTNCELEFPNEIDVRRLMKWLNKKGNKKFKPVYDNNDFVDVYFEGSFNISAIYVGGEIVGFTLTFTPNAPFGFGELETYSFSLTEENSTFTFIDSSDELGYSYPSKFEITCKDSGDLKIINMSDDNYTTVINNCVLGEKITLNCRELIVDSNKSHEKLFNDFNYNYPRFINNFGNQTNIFTTSLPCNIEIKYSPIRKVGIFI